MKPERGGKKVAACAGDVVRMVWVSPAWFNHHCISSEDLLGIFRDVLGTFQGPAGPSQACSSARDPTGIQEMIPGAKT